MADDKDWRGESRGGKSWTVQDARAHFGNVIEAAPGGKPQRVTRRGKDAVVSEDERRRPARPRLNFGGFPATFPGVPDEIDPMAARRSSRSVPGRGLKRFWSTRT
jgi:prevent-host-death family protein